MVRSYTCANTKYQENYSGVARDTLTHNTKCDRLKFAGVPARLSLLIIILDAGIIQLVG